MAPKLTTPPVSPFAAMIAAKAALREFEAGRDLAVPLTPAEQKRVDELRATIAAVEGPNDTAPPPPEPTIEELRADLARLEADAEERRRSETAAHRDRALADWQARRQRMGDDLRRLAARYARAVAEQSAPPVPEGLGDLMAATSDQFDRAVREEIEATPAPGRHASDDRLAGRIAALRREIARREAEGQPTPAQQRQARLARSLGGDAA
ncbi:hypothetical protein [Miltoncostaea marina]|uniref:hypothetical protein n=1 Tax=Miltoncostaea marina TaxID=2843215 RepID=UPI001C3D1496|nr:hypothetical protein [Miltoncostaea marina]